MCELLHVQRWKCEDNNHKTTTLQSLQGDKISQSKGTCMTRVFFAIRSTIPWRKGSGLIEMPTIEETTPGQESEFDIW